MRRGAAKRPLYRKVNTTARGVHHRFGGDYRDDRARGRDDDRTRGSMARGVRRGLDYTPLYRFLRGRVGEPWAATYREAQSRLDDEAAIDGVVARTEAERTAVVRVGEASYVRGMFVDDAGILRLVAPSLGPEALAPFCACCTHTLDGAPFGRPFVSIEASLARWREVVGPRPS